MRIPAPLALLLVLSASFASRSAEAAARRTLEHRLPVDAIEVLAFSITQDVGTRFVTLPPEASPYDTDSLARELAQVSTRIEGRLERVVARVLRDRSLGLVTRLVGLEATVDRGGSARSVAVGGLEGASVSMRVLPSGELLDSVGWEHLYGAGRPGELLTDLLLMSILRLPYAVPTEDSAIPTTFRLRVPVDDSLNRDQTWELTWLAAPSPCGGRCQAFAYEGRIKEAAVDRHPARALGGTGQGSLRGTIVLATRNGALVSHEWELRTAADVRTAREDGSVRAEVAQDRVVRGRIVPAGPP